MAKKYVYVGYSLFSHIFHFIVPIAIIGCGVYFYFHSRQSRCMMQTKNDITYITQGIKSTFMGQKYYLFDNTSVALSDNILPFDIETKNTAKGYIIPNRFGGKMYFYEAFAKISERTLYFANYKDPEKYNKIYGGVSAYILLLTNLNKDACMLMAETDWRRQIPNFLGLEASAVTASTPYNGFYNLRTYLLVDNLNETYKKTSDFGTISRKPMSGDEADQACNCRWNNCMVALKFL
jgi:hypothetical protein